MTWRDVGKLISGSAPVLGAVVGAMVPGAKPIINKLAGLFGAEAKPDDLAAAISKDPEAALKLKRIEHEHDEEITKLFLADVASARQREVEVTRATGKRDKVQALVGLTVLAGFFITLYIVLFLNIHDSVQPLLLVMIGILAGKFGDVVAYFFGSSKGSAEKTAILTGQANRKS